MALENSERSPRVLDISNTNKTDAGDSFAFGVRTDPKFGYLVANYDEQEDDNDNKIGPNKEGFTWFLHSSPEELCTTGTIWPAEGPLVGLVQ